jgi:chemotaxis family two-component system response regulator Rcp1
MIRKIVMVEDNPADAKMLRIALTRRDPKIEIILLEDGAEAIKFFSDAERAHDVPPCDLILMDLNLPQISGFEVLEFVKTSTDLKKTPVVVVSGSSSQQDIERCYAAGANSYISKPVGLEEVFTMAEQLITYWFDHAKSPRAFSFSRGF